MSSYPPGRKIVPNDFFLSELAKENSYPDFYQGSAGSNAVDPRQLDPEYGTQRQPEESDFNPRGSSEVGAIDKTLLDITNNPFVRGFGNSVGGVVDFAKNLVTHPIDTAGQIIQSPFKSALSGVDQAIGNFAGAPEGMGLESAPYIKQYTPEMVPGITEGVKAGLKTALPIAAPGSEVFADPLGKVAEGNVQEGLGELTGLGLGGALLHKVGGKVLEKAPDVIDKIKDIEPAITGKLPFQYNTDAGMFGGNLKKTIPLEDSNNLTWDRQNSWQFKSKKPWANPVSYASEQELRDMYNAIQKSNAPEDIILDAQPFFGSDAIGRTKKDLSIDIMRQLRRVENYRKTKETKSEPSTLDKITEKLPFQYDPTKLGSLGGGFSAKPRYKGQEVDIIGRRGNTVRIKLPDGTEEKVGFSELGRGGVQAPLTYSAEKSIRTDPQILDRIKQLREKQGLSFKEARDKALAEPANQIIDIEAKTEIPKTKYTDITKELSDLLGEDVGKSQELNQEETPFVEGTEVNEPTIDPKDVSIVVPDKNIIPEYGSFPKPGRPGIQGPKLPGGKLPPNKPPNEPPGNSEPPPENPKEPSEYGPKDRIATNLANFVSATKRIRMAMGVPGTGINPHGFSTLARSVGSETPLSPSQASALGKTVKYLVNPSAAEASLNLGKVDLERFNEAAKAQGLGSFAGSEGIEKGDVHGKLSDLFETPLFRKIIPALKMEKAQQLEAANLQSGMEPSKATALAVRQAAETYGGLNNWSKSNAMKILTFAPDWLETNQKLGAGMLRNATKPNSPEGKLYRNLLLNTVGVYALKEIMQRSLGQGSSLSNQPGHEADLKVGQDSEGRNINVRPEATGFDFARIPYEAAMIASKSGGDLKQIGKPIYNRLSDPVKIAIDLLSNTDYAGRPLSGKTSFNQEIPTWESKQTKSGKKIPSEAERLANEIAQLLPSPLQAGFQMSQDQKGYSSPYEAGAELISRSIGLPISFTSNFEPKKLPDVNPLGTNLNPKKKRVY